MTIKIDSKITKFELVDNSSEQNQSAETSTSATMQAPEQGTDNNVTEVQAEQLERHSFQLDIKQALSFEQILADPSGSNNKDEQRILLTLRTHQGALYDMRIHACPAESFAWLNTIAKLISALAQRGASQEDIVALLTQTEAQQSQSDEPNQPANPLILDKLAQLLNQLF